MERLEPKETIEQMKRNGYIFLVNSEEITSWTIKYKCDTDSDLEHCSFSRGRPCYKYYISIPPDTKGWCGFKDRFVQQVGYIDLNIEQEFTTL